MAGRVDDHIGAAAWVRKWICVVSMVMPWSRSAWSASITKDHSNGMPRRRLISRSSLDLAVGQALRVVEQAADQGGFAMIDVADDDDARLNGRIGRGKIGYGNSGGSSYIYPGAAQALESVFGLVVHGLGRPARASGVISEFGNDLVDVGSAAVDRKVMFFFAQRAVSLAVTGEVQRHDRNFLALGIAPDVQSRSSAAGGWMRTWVLRRNRVLQLIPELGRLVLEVPHAVEVHGG